MKVRIENICDSPIAGVRVSRKRDCATSEEDYFQCTPLGLTTPFRTTDKVMGMLEGWHHTPVFRTMETHADAETFYFYEGTALMPFCDIVGGVPDMSTARILRIEAGTQVEVAAGKAHFVAVAEGDHFACIVYCPQQSADRISLPESIEGEY